MITHTPGAGSLGYGDFGSSLGKNETEALFVWSSLKYYTSHRCDCWIWWPTSGFTALRRSTGTLGIEIFEKKKSLEIVEKVLMDVISMQLRVKQNI